MKNSVEIATPRSGIVQFTLNRPDVLNALNADLMGELHQAILEAGRDSSVRAVLITGRGRVFCAGADIRELAALNAQTGLEFAQKGQAIFRALECLGKPSLAAIQGAALGGGSELAMAATMRIAADNAFFGQPEVKLGVIPGFGGTQRLARLVGRGRAMALCLTAARMTATEALAAGLVTEVVPEDLLNDRALDILSVLCALPPLALRSVMAVIFGGSDLPMEEALSLEAAHFAICCGTQDKQEGVSAFVEKRAATFCGE